MRGARRATLSGVPTPYRTLLLLSALLAAYALARTAGLPGTLGDLLIVPVVLATIVLAIRDISANPLLELEQSVIWIVLTLFLTPLAVPAYIRLHGLPWRRML